jgi:hypothetical protein
MARKPRDRGAEGEYDQFAQPQQRRHSGGLFSAVQTGGSLYGLQHSNPVDTEVAYGEGPGQSPPANASTFGTVGPDGRPAHRRSQCVRRGSWAQGGVRVGGLGVSGDASCTDHMVAWRTRNTLSLDKFQGVTSPAAVL